MNWTHCILLSALPVLVLIGCLTTPLRWETAATAVVYYFLTGLGITAGYHRLFSHRSFEASPFFRVLLLLLGSGSVQGSILWWCRDHRAHHRYVDTEKDPYSIQNGLFYAHIGWMLVRKERSKVGPADIKDLENDAWIRAQHKYYPLFAIFMAFVLPTLVCGLLFGDYWGGYFYAGVARLVFVHHSTFCVNSIAHWLGDADYTDGHSARNSFITALITIGEGYHNFHHEDYRNGAEWYHYDPTKWFIAMAEKLGLAHNLTRFPKNEIVKERLQMKEKRLHEKMSKLNWGPSDDELPRYTLGQAKKVFQDELWVIVDGYIVNLSRFAEGHPGGYNIIATLAGRDVTEAFKGGVYRHSQAAHNLVATYRVAILQQ
ncbi:unnamed protein product [Symbiodinium sp. KB8]|nr:unnamed protein product [Symbiodinium sp. KB8]